MIWNERYDRLMLSVTDTASSELKKAIESSSKKGSLIIFFQGMGWSGPALGMALDEPTNEMEKLESNGIEAYIEKRLKDFLIQYGSINIDFVNHPTGSGFTIKAGDGNPDCGSCGGTC